MNEKVRRLFVFARDKNTCQYCLKQSGSLTLEHVVPKSQGGTNRRDNLIVCCYDCNYSRQTMEFTEWCAVVAGLTGQNVGDILDRIRRQLAVSGEFERQGLGSKEQMKRVKGI